MLSEPLKDLTNLRIYLQFMPDNPDKILSYKLTSIDSQNAVAGYIQKFSSNANFYTFRQYDILVLDPIISTVLFALEAIDLIEIAEFIIGLNEELIP